MRSSQLSYRPKPKPTPASSPVLPTGGAGRVRTGDLLSANQALSQLSYSPLLGRQRRLQRCRLMLFNRGQLDTETMSLAHGLSRKTVDLQVETQSGLTGQDSSLPLRKVVELP
jgi:hypothetical protein